MIYDLKIKDGVCVAINGEPFVKNRIKHYRLKNAIYIFRRAGEIIYIGETGRGLYRCIDGLTCSDKQTVAYPWRNDRDIRNADIELMILGVGLPATMAIKESSREVVESDVASLIFAVNGSWPVKLTALKVHGGIARSKSYKSATQTILSELKKRKWLECT